MTALPGPPTDAADLRAWAAGEQVRWERERGHLRQSLCPGVERHPDVQGGEPVLAGSRLTTAALYDCWQERKDRPPERPYGSVYGDLAEDYHAPGGWNRVAMAVAFEAGRRWGEAHDRAERKRRTVASVTDSLAWLAEGERRGVLAAAARLRALAREEQAREVEALLETDAIKEGA